MAYFNNIYKLKGFESKIAPTLFDMSERKLNFKQIIHRLNYFDQLTYSPRSHSNHNDRRSYDMKELYKNFGEQLPQIYQNIASEILIFEKYQNLHIPIFFAGHELQKTFSKSQIVYLLCLMSLMLVPPQPYEFDKSKESNFNHLKNFAFIFSSEGFKTVGVITYLKKYFIDKKKEEGTCLTLKRKVIKKKLAEFLQSFGNQKMHPLSLESDKEDIQNFYGTSKVDFANQYIGGGAMSHGAVQEQIMFATHPQMYISVLLCEVLNSNQALEFIGFKKYFISKGYGRTGVQLGGFNNVNYNYDEKNRAKQYIVAIDAIDFKKSKMNEFNPQVIDKQIFKALVGFYDAPSNIITTGNWGCGAFGGNVELKFLIQWIAASLAGKKLFYCPFGKSKLLKNYIKLENKKIREVYIALIKGQKSSYHNNYDSELDRVINSLKG